MSNINRTNISNPSLDQTAFVQKKDAVRPAEPERVSSRPDSIVLSGKAKAIERLSGLVQQSRSERLERVREMLESGTYSVSGTEIARKMIESNRKY